jgi:hypothetical protein
MMVSMIVIHVPVLSQWAVGDGVDQRAKNSGKMSVSCTVMQNKIGSHDVFFKDPDCAAPLPYYGKKKTVMFTTNLASSSATSGGFVSATEYSEVWYTSKELADISNLAKLARQSTWILSGGEEINEDECFRGLEDTLSIRASQALKGRKIGVALAVLNEQRRQSASRTQTNKNKSDASRKSGRWL